MEPSDTKTPPIPLTTVVGLWGAPRGTGGAWLSWLTRVEQGYMPHTELFQGTTEAHAIRKARDKADELGKDEAVVRVLYGPVACEARRELPPMDRKIVLPFNRLKVNGKRV